MQIHEHFRNTYIILAILFMATYFPAYAADEIWGKRIWERKLDNQHQIVVDERGEGKELRGLEYCWRLLKSRENDGPVLFRCSGVEQYSGTGTLFDKIDMLYTDLIGGDLVTVFNQDGLCWAHVAHRNKDGTITSRPDGNHLMYDSDIRSTMKSGSIIKRNDGLFELTVQDNKGKSFEFELRPREKHPDIYYWKRLGPATAAPAEK